MVDAVNLYNNVYGDYESHAEAAVRRQTYGEDIGQSSWMTATEWLRFADQLQVQPESHVLEIGSGSGGPAVHLAAARGCQVTGVDINDHGVRNAERLAASRGVADRVTSGWWTPISLFPFRRRHLTRWSQTTRCATSRIAWRYFAIGTACRPHGRILFTDAMIVSGLVSHEELAVRSSIGFYLFVPPGENERLIVQAGFTLVGTEDVTDSAAAIAQLWHDAREEHRVALVEREGDANFAGLQRFLACVQRLSAERRLSRYCYLAEKAA